MPANKRKAAKKQKSKLEPCDKTRILIVDDEKMVREVFMRIMSFSLPDCRIDMAVNGAEAISSFREARHGVLLMDLRMPVMDGEEAFNKIEALCRENKWEIPAVIFCTGYVPSDDIQKIAENNRKHALLKKPVTNDVLIETIKSRL
ncbi:response regulator [Verrucomicrobiota bacterium]